MADSAIADRPAARPARGGIIASIGALGAAFLASLCCLGPLLFVTVGVGAGLATRFEPLRPTFTVIAIGFLVLGFHRVYGRGTRHREECAPDGACVSRRPRTRDQFILWSASVLAIALLTFPEWSVIFL